MLVKFKQAVHLDGKDYPRGTHDVPESAMKDSFFHNLIKAGLVVDGEAVKTVSPLSLAEQQKLLVERLMANQKAVAAPKKESLPPTQPSEAGSEPKSSESPSEEIVEEEEVSDEAADEDFYAEEAVEESEAAVEPVAGGKKKKKKKNRK